MVLSEGWRLFHYWEGTKNAQARVYRLVLWVQKGERITTTITIEVPFEIVVELLFALYVHGVNGGNRAFL